MSVRSFDVKDTRILAPSVITVEVDLINGRAKKSKNNKKRRNKKARQAQTTITKHFATTAKPNELASMTDKEVEHVKTLVPETLESNETQWEHTLSTHQLFEVKAVANGHCLFCSFFLVKTVGHPKVISTKDAFVCSETDFYRDGVYNELIARYRWHVSTGLIVEAEHCRSITGSAEVTEQAREKVQAYLDKVKALRCKEAADYKYWPGETEIKAAAYWFREPILVFDKDKTGTIFAWLYHMALTKPDANGLEHETVEAKHMTLAAACSWIKSFQHARVIPLVLVLRRNHKEPQSNHFNAVRLLTKSYKAWAGTTKKRAATQVRRDCVLREAGLYVPPHCNPLMKDLTPVAPTEGSDETYLPNELSSQETKDGDGVEDSVEDGVTDDAEKPEPSLHVLRHERPGLRSVM